MHNFVFLFFEGRAGGRVALFYFQSYFFLSRLLI